MIDKLKIQDLIRIFYQQPFKIFYVNSIDGKTYIKPTGLFISLGIATSMSTFDKLINVIKNTYPETCPRLVELVSVHLNGEFLNTITNSEPLPYKITEYPSNVVLLDMDDAEKELNNLRELIRESPTQERLVSTQKLQECIERLKKNGSENQRIQKQDDDYKIFHMISNYKKVKDKEYRIGIYVL